MSIFPFNALTNANFPAVLLCTYDGRYVGFVDQRGKRSLYFWDDNGHVLAKSLELAANNMQTSLALKDMFKINALARGDANNLNTPEPSEDLLSDLRALIDKHAG